MNDLIHTSNTEATAAQATAVVEESTPETGNKKKSNPLLGIWKSPKKRKRLIWLLVLVVIAGGLVWGMSKLLAPNTGDSQVLTDEVQIGSITSVVEGSGTTKAKQSESITITTAGTVMDVYVNEGDVVEAGTPLFSIDSPAAQDLVNKARTEVEVRQKELNDLYDAANNLTVKADGIHSIGDGNPGRADCGGQYGQPHLQRGFQTFPGCD